MSMSIGMPLAGRVQVTAAVVAEKTAELKEICFEGRGEIRNCSRNSSLWINTTHEEHKHEGISPFRWLGIAYRYYYF
jgi:hypothetical protein